MASLTSSLPDGGCGANPQRPQRFPVPKFLARVEEQVKKGYQGLSSPIGG